MKREIIEKILKEANENPDGFTVKLTNGQIDKITFDKNHRYAVSLTNNDNREKSINMLKRLPDNFNGYIGGWKDKQTDTYYIDLTIIVSDLTIAIIIGKTFNQKTIWDGVEFKEIRVDKLEYHKKAFNQVYGFPTKRQKMIVLKEGKYSTSIDWIIEIKNEKEINRESVRTMIDKVYPNWREYDIKNNVIYVKRYKGKKVIITAEELYKKYKLTK